MYVRGWIWVCLCMLNASKNNQLSHCTELNYSRSRGSIEATIMELLTFLVRGNICKNYYTSSMCIFFEHNFLVPSSSPDWLCWHCFRSWAEEKNTHEFQSITHYIVNGEWVQLKCAYALVLCTLLFTACQSVCAENLLSSIWNRAATMRTKGREHIDCTRKCKWRRSEIGVHKSSRLRSSTILLLFFPFALFVFVFRSPLFSLVTVRTRLVNSSASTFSLSLSNNQVSWDEIEIPRNQSFGAWFFFSLLSAPLIVNMFVGKKLTSIFSN